VIKVDFHTHSKASYDGGISVAQYQRAIDRGLLDCIAVTDHNRIDFAEELQLKLGEHIIIGEEIMTKEGEIIGLFLERAVDPGLSPLETMKQIKHQSGIVYIPHPFETVRKGLHPSVLEELAEYIDVVEICNGRAFFQNRSEQAVVWTRMNHKLGAASSDAHGFRGLGKTYTSLAALPTRENLLELLVKGIPMTDHPGLRALLYPKYHRLRKKLGGKDR
jgi:predicted metal-dependent phosphoesterase TrpH